MQSSEQTIRVHGCKLTRAVLEAVWQTATRDASDRARTSISTTIGITKTEANSLDDLITQLGEPKRLLEVKIHVSDQYTGSDEYKSTYISIDTESVYIDIDGTDETWVRGRTAELRELFRRTRSRLGMDPDIAGLSPLFLGAAVLLGSVIYAIADASSNGHWLLIIWAIAVPVGIALWIVLRRQSATVIALTANGGAPWNRSDQIATTAAIIAFVTLIIIAIQTWGH